MSCPPLRQEVERRLEMRWSPQQIAARLLFDSSYTRALVEIGYRDAGERIEEIEAFLR